MLAALPVAVAAGPCTPVVCVGVCVPCCCAGASGAGLLLLLLLLWRAVGAAPRLCLLPRRRAVWGTAGLMLLLLLLLLLLLPAGRGRPVLLTACIWPVVLLLLLLRQAAALLLLPVRPVLPPVTGLGWACGGEGRGQGALLQQEGDAGSDASLEGSSQLVGGQRGVGCCVGLGLLLLLLLIEGQGVGHLLISSVITWGGGRVTPIHKALEKPGQGGC